MRDYKGGVKSWLIPKGLRADQKVVKTREREARGYRLQTWSWWLGSSASDSTACRCAAPIWVVTCRWLWIRVQKSWALLVWFKIMLQTHQQTTSQLHHFHILVGRILQLKFVSEVLPPSQNVKTFFGPRVILDCLYLSIYKVLCNFKNFVLKN